MVIHTCWTSTEWPHNVRLVTYFQIGRMGGRLGGKEKSLNRTELYSNCFSLVTKKELLTTPDLRAPVSLELVREGEESIFSRPFQV